jgi:potassium efflux system protein
MMAGRIKFRPAQFAWRPQFYLVALLFSILALLTPSYALALNGDILTRAEVQSQLDALNKQKTLSPGEKLAQQDLNRTLEFLDGIDRLKQENQQLKQQVQQAPVKLNQALNGLDSIRQADSEAITRTSLSTLTLRQLENKMGTTLDALQSAQEDLANFNSQLISLQTQPERAQSSMMETSQQIQQIRNALSDPSNMRTTQQNMLNTQMTMLNMSLDYQRQSLSANTALQDSLQKQRDYANARINQLERMVQLVREVENGKRLTLSEKTAQEAQNPDDATQDIQHDPIIGQELDINRQLSKRLIEATEGVNALVQENIRIKNWLDRSLQAERNLKEQITVLKGSLLLSRILYQQQQNLPTEKLTNNVAEQIADLRLEQFDINEKRDALYQGNDYVTQLISQSKEKPSDDVVSALEDIVDARRELLDQLNKQLGSQLTLAISLQINQQQLLSVNEYLQHTLTQQIFWVSSNKPMNLNWFIDLPSALKGQSHSLHFDLKPGALAEGALNSMFVLVPLLVLFGLFRWRYHKIDELLEKLGNEVGQLKRDTQLHTPKAIGLTMLKGLPGTLLILAFGFWCYRSDISINNFLWSLSLQFAMFWMFITTTYRLLEPGGVSEKHFNLSPLLCAHYRRVTRRVGVVLIPLIFWCVLGEKAPLRLSEDVIGQVVVLITLGLISAFVFPICRDAWREKNSHTVRLIMVTLLALTPLVLMVLTAFGYLYTALSLGIRWLDSLYLMIFWTVIYSSAIRGLSVAARRLAYRRALARRQQNVAREGAEGLEPVEEPPLAIDQINSQSLRLTTMVLFLIFGTVLYWIWSDLVTVISYLDSITLWHYSSGSGASHYRRSHWAAYCSRCYRWLLPMY